MWCIFHHEVSMEMDEIGSYYDYDPQWLLFTHMFQMA